MQAGGLWTEYLFRVGLWVFIFKWLMGKAICNYVINYISSCCLCIHLSHGCRMIGKVIISARGNVEAYEIPVFTSVI